MKGRILVSGSIIAVVILVLASFPSVISPKSPTIETLSFENDILDSFNYTFEMQEKLPPPQDWFDEEGNQIYVPNETDEYLNEYTAVLTLCYFPNAEFINIYRKNFLLLPVDVSKYHDLDADKVIAVVDNCPYDYNPDEKDSDRDGLGDDCDQ